MPENAKQRYDAWHEAKTGEDIEKDLQNPWNSFVLRNLPDISGKRVLDIASGRGQLSRAMAERGGIVTSADFSFSAVSIARKRIAGQFPESTFVNADAQKLPFKDGSFDVVVSCETIEHVPDMALMARELARVARDGALLLLTSPNYLNCFGLHKKLKELRGRQYNSGAGVQPVENTVFFFRNRKLLEKHGVKILKTEGAVFCPILLPRVNPLTLRLKFLEKFPCIKYFCLHFCFVGQIQKGTPEKA